MAITYEGNGFAMIETDSTGREELAADTLDRLRRALTDGETPCVARIIEIISRMSDKADSLSTQDLAEAIGQDMTAMIKVMKAANCLQFNPSALEVSTVTRAVSVIGFNKIQNLTLSLLLLEGAENRANTSESCDVSARSLCSALLAEELTRSLSLADPEEAFVCTALRSYGRLMLSTFLIDEYREALQLAATMAEDRAFRLVFGLTPLEVSRHLLEQVNLATIGSSLFQPLPPALLQHKHPAREEALQLAAALATGLSDLLNKPDLTTSEYERQADRWLEQFRPAFGLDRDALKGIFDRVRNRLDDFKRAQDVEVFNSAILQRINSLADGLDLTALPPTARPPKPPAATVPEGLMSARGPLAAAVKRIRDLLGPRSTPANTAYTLAASAIRAALHLEGCVVFVREELGIRYCATAGEGAFFRLVEGKPLIDPARRDVFTLCVLKGEDVLIQDSADERIAPFIPPWFHEALDGGAFLLLPLKDSQGAFAVICGIAARGRRIELGVTRLAQFKTLRKLLSGLRPGAAPPEAAPPAQADASVPDSPAPGPIPTAVTSSAAA